jgi:hypothetical protein
VRGAARRTDGGAVADGKQLGAITEALDHLLDPLEEPIPANEPARPRAPAVYVRLPAEPSVRRTGVLRSLRKLAARIRWSRSDRFRIPRILARWALLLAVVWGVIWFVSARLPV